MMGMAPCRGWPRLLLLLLPLLGGAGAAWAGAFSVSPIRVDLSARHVVEALTVHNVGDAATLVQLDVVAWSQHDGKNVYLPSTDLLATPPIFTVAAGATQVVRVGLRRGVDARSELTYRVYLQEVAPAPKPGFQGLQVALRIGVPVFVAPVAPAAPVLHWRAQAAGAGELRLTLANDGAMHTRISGLTLAQGATPALTKAAPAYVLAGQRVSWKIGMAVAPGAPLRLGADSDAGPLHADLTLEPDGPAAP